MIIIRSNKLGSLAVKMYGNKRQPMSYEQSLYAMGKRKPRYPVPAIPLTVIFHPGGCVAVLSNDQVEWYNNA